jgi:hypothetical protein
LRYQDIWFGESYRIKMTLHRAEVIGMGKKGTNGRYRFPVRYPDARPTGKLANVTKMVEAADFSHKWTDEDQEHFDKHQQESAELEALTSGLVAAGYPPYAIRRGSGVMQLHLSFDNETAHEVIEVLLANPQGQSATRGTKAIAQSRKELPNGNS